MAFVNSKNMLYSHLKYRPNGTIVKVYINEDWREIRDSIGLYTFGEKIGWEDNKVVLKYIPEDKHPTDNLTDVYCIESQHTKFKGKIVIHEREIKTYT